MNQEPNTVEENREDAEIPVKEGDTASEPAFSINDRRFWARGEGQPETGAPNEAEGKKPSYVEELERKLAEKEERLQATLVQYKEALDDFENAKARLRRDITKEIEAGKRSMLADLLEVVDNLERAISAASQSPNDSLRTGVTMVYEQFLLKLQALGVEKVDAMGKPFDPVRFEAVSMVPVQQAAQDGVIVGVVRTCYIIGSETLRHGMVAVGKFDGAGSGARSDSPDKE